MYVCVKTIETIGVHKIEEMIKISIDAILVHRLLQLYQIHQIVEKMVMISHSQVDFLKLTVACKGDGSIRLLSFHVFNPFEASTRDPQLFDRIHSFFAFI